MSFILVDLENDKHDIQINGWNWRPILVFLYEAGLIDDEQHERMGAQGCGGQLTAEQASAAAAFLKREILPRLATGERMHANGAISPNPREPQPIASSSTHELYAVSKSCLESFITFCEASKGFNVF